MNEIQFHQGTSYRLNANFSTRCAIKPVVVLIHGVGLNQDMWSSWIPALQADFYVLTFDLLGHGQSHNPVGNRSAVDFTNQLHELLTHLDVDRFALIGFSLGALVGQAFASLYSDDNSNRLTHLVLLHSVYRRTDDGYLKAYALFCNAEAEMKNYPLAQVKCQALVITGGDDVGSTPAMSEALAQNNSELATFPR